MKKYLLLIGLVAILTTGCGNTNKIENNDVESIARKIAIASVNGDDSSKKNYLVLLHQKTEDSVSDMQYSAIASSKFLKTKYNLDTTNKTICSVVTYKDKGREKFVGYCK